MNQKLDYNSKIKEIYHNPIGHDIVYKLLLQMNIKESMITNPFVANLKLKTVSALSRKVLDRGFFQTLLELLNSEQDIPDSDSEKITKVWWKQAVFYQIYPRSFQDSNGDGVGDIRGIINRLDYLKELGVDAVWLSPIYDSPNDDNGYDIRDYCSIMKEFGTMEDFEQLLTGIHNRGMKLIMDLVVNHTSDEHPWFQAALSDRTSKYGDYYLFQKSEDDNPPNNWNSFFSGSAWNYYKERDEWALHLFSKKQMDLNWENPKVREEIQQMIRWWLMKGVDGFRLDVINYISKKEGLPQGNDNIGKLMGYYGIEHYFYGPKLHRYLKELKEKAFLPFSAFTVGETPGAGMEMSKLLTAENRNELDMIFSFDHLETPGHERFDDYRYDLNYLKEYLITWMEQYGNQCWMSLFYENHDNPRMISKVNPDPAYRKVLGKLLAMILLTLKGTPFLFQGQEIGCVNQSFRSIEDFKDIESINLYHELVSTLGEEAALKKVLCGSRDHSRTPMPWNADRHAGFTEGEPWIFMEENNAEWNVADQLKDKDSVYHFYRQLIQLRKQNPVLVYGSFEVTDRKKRDVFAYYRRLGDQVYYIECNLSDKAVPRGNSIRGYQRLISNYKNAEERLRPYEANLYQVT